MKIALIKPNNSIFVRAYPLGLGYISSYLKQNNIDSIVIDASIDNLSDTQIIDIFKKENITVAGLSCTTADHNVVARLSLNLKKEGFKVVIGGIHPTFLPFQTLVDSGADFVICGEGEIAFTKLALNNFVNNGIKGVYSLDNLKSTTDRVEFAETVKKLDELPFPPWEKVQFKKYNSSPSGQIRKKTPIAYLVASRGCLSKCTFCASPAFSQKHIRFRSVENIISEIKELVNVYGVKEIKFLDDTITLHKKYMLELCAALLKNKLSISWACYNGVRADSLDEEVVAAMKLAGCYGFSIGVESANPDILKNIRKDETIEQISKAINLAHKYKMMTNGFFIFGLPGETKETMRQTLNFALKSNLPLATFAIFSVLPGSELWHTLNWKFDRNTLDNPNSTPTWISESITSADLIKFHKKAFLKFYFRPKIIFGLVSFLNFSTIKNFFIRVKLFRKA
ncbi:MAG: B12-binding domain-containing radical SAM protein [Elusimicrobia bacterium]|nr:B12-binding domain-containing radical SAM protein [Elusimicrobiota bacterium]